MGTSLSPLKKSRRACHAVFGESGIGRKDGSDK